MKIKTKGNNDMTTLFITEDGFIAEIKAIEDDINHDLNSITIDAIECNNLTTQRARELFYKIRRVVNIRLSGMPQVEKGSGSIGTKRFVADLIGDEDKPKVVIEVLKVIQLIYSNYNILQLSDLDNEIRHFVEQLSQITAVTA